MKTRLIILLMLFCAIQANATTPACVANKEGRVLSNEEFSPLQAGQLGYQYIFSVDSSYGGFQYTRALVLVGKEESPDLMFFPSLESNSFNMEEVSGIFYHSSILKDALLIVEYGNYCRGKGYEITYKFSETIASYDY